MTEFNIQKTLFNYFLTLDTYAVANGYKGEPFLVTVDNEVVNVHLPNKPFTVPDDKRWFDLTFRNNEPENAYIVEDSMYRFTGVLYIDIFSETDVEESEVETKYSWIAKLFNSANLDYIDIRKVYISTKGNDADCYRLQVAVEWEADIDKE